MTTSADDPRIAHALDVILQLTSGNLNARATTGDRADEVDGIITGINMLAEELQNLFVSLSTARADLEVRVRERIEELSQANEYLRHELEHSARAEAALQQANAELQRRAGELEQRNYEMGALTELGDMLQVCATAAEAYQVINQAARRLFPGDSGGLFIFSASRNLAEAMSVWGDAPPEERVFEPEACWGLRRGQAHLELDGGASLLCHHVRSRNDLHAYLCLPMTAQNETLGVLHLLVSALNRAEDVEHQLEAKRRLAVGMAETCALALANLRLRDTLRALSIRDSLTGLFNRRYMEETLAREMARAVRRHTPLSLIMLDLDHFKLFNDTFGHEAGDAVLKDLGRFLQSEIRKEDVACRYGGEEFTLILPGAPLETALKRAENLRARAEGLRVQYMGQMLGALTLSLGIATYPEHGETKEGLIQAADDALYRAKNEGRNRVVVSARGQ